MQILLYLPQQLAISMSLRLCTDAACSIRSWPCAQASQLGSSRALMGYTQQQHDPLFAQQQAYAVARRRAELAAAAQQETEEERAVLIQHARLSQARMQAAQAQQRAEVSPCLSSVYSPAGDVTTVAAGQSKFFTMIVDTWVN